MLTVNNRTIDELISYAETRKLQSESKHETECIEGIIYILAKAKQQDETECFETRKNPIITKEVSI
ncbi:MAG: hypothetical protein A2Z57_03340 [Planctomycetes bacterium RIFCSPHIGHO2_12_39_6]|nr:MAG: hypothetical protein A2Z57_03340 [Planctomycetes bacterium RIFCSPHIGHO2_12_39_6]